MPRQRERQLTTLVAAVLACALAAGCLETDTEALQESDEDGTAFTELADPVSHEDITAVPEIVDTDDLIPRALLSFQGDKGEAHEGEPDTDRIEGLASAYASWSFVWQQGWAAVPMGSTSDRFCFLTAVQGRFEGGGESVHVYISGGSWWLGGSSQQQGVAARALCIPRNYYGQILNISQEYRWWQGAYATHMGSDTNRVCFLMYVTGDFEGGGEQVEAYRSAGSWWLGGSSYQRGVGAGARCVNTNYRNGPYYWSQGQGSVLMSNATYWACGLTRMAGRFKGGGERVNAFVSGSWWYLGGSSYQKGVATAAYCL